MMYYCDGFEVCNGDHVAHGTAAAVVEELIEGDEVERWGLEEPGFLILCNHCGSTLIYVGSEDWEDVTFIRRRG